MRELKEIVSRRTSRPTEARQQGRWVVYAGGGVCEWVLQAKLHRGALIE